MFQTERLVLDGIEEQKPHAAPFRLSRPEKDRLIQRGFLGLYRWYVGRSQTARNWDPDRGFNWRAIRKDHSPELLSIIEGYFAVEQYTPDYTSGLTQLVRRNYGRSNFQIRWGAEEAKHADLWRNVLLFSGARRPEWIERYTDDLRGNSWTLPWEDPLHMLLYTVIQERATQLNYLNTARVARGESAKGWLANDADPVLADVARTIAVDEAAHYNFFLEGARLYLYYYPEETLQALVDVLRNFTMPASDIVYNYDAFTKVLYEADIFGRRKYVRDVVQTALDNLGVANIKTVEAGIKRSRRVPDEDGQTRDTATFDGVEFTVVESAIERLFARIGRYEDEIGLSEVDPTRFVPNTWTLSDRPSESSTRRPEL
jgi:acyl-[acyl-carrier-protein] desaturase